MGSQSCAPPKLIPRVGTAVYRRLKRAVVIQKRGKSIRKREKERERDERIFKITKHIKHEKTPAQIKKKLLNVSYKRWHQIDFSVMRMYVRLNTCPTISSSRAPIGLDAFFGSQKCAEKEKGNFSNKTLQITFGNYINFVQSQFYILQGPWQKK